MATHTDAPPPYTPGSPEFIEITATTIEQMESANRALEIIAYSLLVNLEIIIYSLLVNLKIIAYPLLVDLKSIAYYLAVDIPKLVKAISFEWPTYNSFRASCLQKKECALLLHLSQTHTKYFPNKRSPQQHEQTCHNMPTRTREQQHELDILNMKNQHELNILDKKRELIILVMKWQTIHLLVICISGIICFLAVCLT
ncbi:hypothetical protein GT037_010124 [Alternaria burnsii]|uniref:Uncharacterized protein n=1 Tax=Alternaria burnsii TaxID=1187904 RepID=A0A8H7EDH7_9PLEO|nr:uncharacterized protein GT037_010124 [Alternaria burnsii]KAF7671901.1 hypothetical protein GT037_010124 [Alternaria burnsii]